MSLVHISGWVQVTDPSRPEGPIDPGYGRPGGGWSPTDPGYGRPDWAPALPGHDLPGRPPHISTGPIYGGGHPEHGLPHPPHRPGNKPPSYPILPIDPDWDKPVAPPHPWIPGHWLPVDPGWGKPPVFGFWPVDPGYGIEAPPTTPGTPLPTPPGHWVPIDPGYGRPECKPKPIWVWIVEIGPDLGIPQPK